jgi:hypothetical protein
MVGAAFFVHGQTSRGLTIQLRDHLCAGVHFGEHKGVRFGER